MKGGLNSLSLAIEIGSSFGMILMIIGAMVCIVKSKERVKTFMHMVIFLTLLLSYAFQAALSVLDYYSHKQGNLSRDDNIISNLLYAF